MKSPNKSESVSTQGEAGASPKSSSIVPPTTELGVIQILDEYIEQCDCTACLNFLVETREKIVAALATLQGVKFCKVSGRRETEGSD